jgi:hypothetical protein
MAGTTQGGDNPDALPEPPDSPPRSLPSLAEELVTVWRIHAEADPRTPRRYPTGRYRFDAPRGEFPVTYGNHDQLVTFREVYGDTRLIAAEQGARQLSHLASLRPLRLVRLDDPAILDALDPRLDQRLCTAKQYATTQRWSAALHRWYPRADGVRFPSRHSVATGLNYCLYLDRVVPTDLHWTCLGTLSALRSLVLYAADCCHLQCRLVWTA